MTNEPKKVFILEDSGGCYSAYSSEALRDEAKRRLDCKCWQMDLDLDAMPGDRLTPTVIGANL